MLAPPGARGVGDRGLNRRLGRVRRPSCSARPQTPDASGLENQAVQKAVLGAVGLGLGLRHGPDRLSRAARGGRGPSFWWAFSRSSWCCCWGVSTLALAAGSSWGPIVVQPSEFMKIAAHRGICEVPVGPKRLDSIVEHRGDQPGNAVGSRRLDFSPAGPWNRPDLWRNLDGHGLCRRRALVAPC